MILTQDYNNCNHKQNIFKLSMVLLLVIPRTNRTKITTGTDHNIGISFYRGLGNLI